MSFLILCRERLKRLLRVLDQVGGSSSIRDLQRNHGIWWWETEQAAELGWVRISVKKPRVGRPSRIVEKLNNLSSAKYPKFRFQLPKRINHRHRKFAYNIVYPSNAGDVWSLRSYSNTAAYMETYPACKSRAAAAAGACRLLKRKDVRLMVRWVRCEYERKVTGYMPFTVEGIIEQLEPLGYIQRIYRPY